MESGRDRIAAGAGRVKIEAQRESQNMTDLQIFESLCDIIARQAEVIKTLVTQLQELDAITDETADSLYELEVDFEAVTGDSDLYENES